MAHRAGAARHRSRLVAAGRVASQSPARERSQCEEALRLHGLPGDHVSITETLAFVVRLIGRRRWPRWCGVGGLEGVHDRPINVDEYDLAAAQADRAEDGPQEKGDGAAKGRGLGDDCQGRQANGAPPPRRTSPTAQRLSI